MKKLPFALLVSALLLFGLTPLFYGFYASLTRDADVVGGQTFRELVGPVVQMAEPVEEPAAAAPVEAEPVMMEPEEVHRMVASIPDDHDTFSEVHSSEMEELDTDVAAVEPPPEPVTLTPPEELFAGMETSASAPAEKTAADIAKEWSAVFGTVTTPLLAWATFFYSRFRKPKVEPEVAEQDQMGLLETLEILWGALSDKHEWKRFKFRRNEKWSIYGASLTRMYPPTRGRPMQHISRNNTPSEIVAQAQPDISHWDIALWPIREVKTVWDSLRTQIADYKLAAADKPSLNHWMVNQYYSELNEIVNELETDFKEREVDEVAIAIIMRYGDKVTVYTLQSGGGLIPDSFREWEDLLIQFHERYATLSKDYALLDVVAFHSLVNRK